MDGDSTLISVSLIGLMLTPFCAKLWAALFARWQAPLWVRATVIVIMSVATLGLVFVGPWMAMAARKGLLTHNMSDPDALSVAAILFVPALIAQVIFALMFALRRD